MKQPVKQLRHILVGNRSELILVVLLLLATILACGGSPVADDPSPTATSTPVATPTATATSTQPTTPTNPSLQEARVVNVVDGDTIDVLIDGVEYRVRYILVDTPETKHPTKGVEPFGPEASDFNRQLVEGQTVLLEKDVSETDQYGRLLRYVYVGETMVNEELLRRGLARVATFPPDVKYVDRFLAVQREAQAAGVGIWEDAAPPADDTGLVIVGLNKRAEYVDLRNNGSDPVDLIGWRLLSERGNQDCPLGGLIGPDETLRVWALAADADQGGFNCGFGSNIWSNSEPDPAVLFDPNGNEVSRME